MRSWRNELKRAWTIGIQGPNLALGWGLAVLLFTGLRLLGQVPGWSVAGIALILLTLIVGAWQLTQLTLTLIGRRPAAWQSWQLVWRNKGTWLFVELGLIILTLPFGLWGLSSRLLVRLPVPAMWVNAVGLHRRPVGIVVAIIYVVVAGYCLLWGPRHFRRLTPQISHPGTWRQMVGALLVTAGLTLAWLIWAELFVGLNWWWGPHLGAGSARFLAWGSLGLILLGLLLVTSLSIITLVWSWCGQPSVTSSRSPRRQLGALVGVIVFAAACISTQAIYQTPQFSPMALISHRGVDHGHGVQNTLGALRYVSRQHPTYVEMDLHEARDHQWVVLHDENLATLAGRNVTPHSLTLAQLQRLTVHENGYHDHLVSWSTYLRTAERLHQPLLVEIKTTPADSQGMAARFAREYGPRLAADHSAVHSLDYRVVTQVKRTTPQLRVGYITPFNWVAPSSIPADFYSFQRISVSQQFILAAHQLGAKAYLWTPDSRSTMTRMWALGADGQITNELSRLRGVSQQRPAANWWAVLQNFVFSYL
ncbi:glycerophosphodiester phosphodiesterase [Levilactobacillus lanxiensis]|uniref:Glycerophosphodiester phosphodiesterase n=1 Tax=Levilactobacillus lanxiensis TaxID=2799568 RepID=A0ABW4D6A3_9LACO|nr:glycerophosphodiester phosphodiesterase [Levilactobacillus lanxiensis]